LNAFSSIEEVKQINIFPYTDVEVKDAESGSTKLKVRWLITKETGAENFAMRLFEIEAGGKSPLHSHNWEHEVSILENAGTVVGGQEEKIQIRRRHFHSRKRETSTEEQQKKNMQVSLLHTIKERITGNS
jgi:hypothetical protein